ncbi:MAG: hypothetical protein GWN07_37690, partial [Actinobacteria bacterium]|nr:hypothetical protein [Actinomycetota bacterium]
DTDTDGDGISDADEKRIWRSNPTRQDTDEDGLADSTDVEFDTSPILDDTDGDGFNDYEELFELNRDPLLADLPRPQIVVTSYDLQLEVKTSFTDETGTVQSYVETNTTSISQAAATSLSQGDTRSVETTNTTSQTLGFEAGVDGPKFVGKVTGEFGFEQTSARGYTASVDRTTATESQRSQEASVGTAFETSELRSVT